MFTGAPVVLVVLTRFVAFEATTTVGPAPLPVTWKRNRLPTSELVTI